MRLLRILLVIVCSLLPFSGLQAQLSVGDTLSTVGLAQMLAGSGVTISNVSCNCDTTLYPQIGSFADPISSVGLGQGVILTTGDINNALGPNSAGSTGTGVTFGPTPDPDLSPLIAPITVNDVCYLQFDLEVTGDSLEFQYVFASEEYPEFVCGTVNDVFGFFISGPGIVGSQNMAIIPGSSPPLPVAINSLNDGAIATPFPASGCESTAYSSLYVNNPLGEPNYEYDGRSVRLTARVGGLIPCSVYTLKLAIGDGGDAVYDSGVFIEAGSITSRAVAIAAGTIVGEGFVNAIEGCVDGLYTFTLPEPAFEDYVAHYVIGGSAINGVDYDMIPDSVIIPAGDSFTTLTITPIVDGISEPLDSVTLYLISGCTGLPYDSATIHIQDSIVTLTLAAVDTICSGDSTSLTAAGGTDFHWYPDYNIDDTSSATPMVWPDTTTTYSVRVDLGTCSVWDSITVYVDPPPTLVEAGPGDSICLNQITSLSGTVVAPGSYNYVWRPANGLSDSTSLTPFAEPSATTDYVLHVFSPSGCVYTDTATITVTGVAPIIEITASDTIICECDTVSFSVTPVLAGYAYSWSGASFDDSTSTTPTTYICGNASIMVNADDGFCTASDIRSIRADSLQLSSMNDTTICTVAPVPLNITVVSDAPPSYNWSPAATLSSAIVEDPIANPLATTLYTVDVDNGACTATDSILVTVGGLTLTLNGEDLNCFNDSSGYAWVTLSSGTPPYTFNWSNGGTNDSIASLLPGMYVLTVSDSLGCFGVDSIEINEPPLLVPSVDVTDVSCAGLADGSALSSVVGGTAPFTYSWSSGGAMATEGSLLAGNYVLTVEDDNGCVDSVAFTVNEPDTLLVTIIDSVDLSCNSSMDGALSISVIGGTTPYTFDWGGGVVDSNLTMAAAGTYTITVTDNNGCTDMATASLSEPDSLILSLVDSSNLSCNAAGDGSITTTTVGGTGPYSFLWGDGNTDSVRTSLAAGVYTLTVTDANGCTDELAVNITEPAPLLAQIIDSTDITCHGADDGTLTTAVSGGTYPYAFDWGGGISDSNRTGLSAGTYSYTVTDANGCMDSATASISEPDSLIASIFDFSNLSCNASGDGSITTIVTGGTNAYSFDWGGGVTDSNLTGLAAGYYEVTVTDANGCVDTAGINLTEPTAIVLATGVTNALCNGASDGTAWVTGTGGVGSYTYLWSSTDADSLATGLSAGTYTVTVTDSTGCTMTANATVGEPIAISLVTNSTNVSCSGFGDGTANVNASNGVAPYSYVWSTGDMTAAISGLSPGTYTVTVTDDNGCTTTASVSVVENPPMVLNMSTTPASCDGASDGTATVNASGGTGPGSYTYLWSNGMNTSTITGLIATTYDVTVTDGNGCTVASSTTVSEPPPVTLSTVVTDATCFGEDNGSIVATGGGGVGMPFTYSIDGVNFQSGQDFAPLAAGSYTIYVRDANGCETSAVYEVDEPPFMAVYILPQDTTVQLTQSVQLQTAVAPYDLTDVTNFLWSPVDGLSCIDCPNPMVTAYEAVNEYVLTLTYGQDCESSATVTVYVENPNQPYVPNAFTPNNDGWNDVFELYGDGIKWMEMLIFDRWGEKMFDAKSQYVGWDGMYKGEPAPNGVYVYYVNGQYLDGKEFFIEGSVTLIR